MLTIFLFFPADVWTIPAGEKYVRQLVQEPEQAEERRETVQANVPLNSLYIAFQCPARTDKNYYVVDLISDLLSRGNSSRLFRNLLKEKQLFSEINAYITGSFDKGMFVVEGKPSENVSLAEAEAAIWEELNKLVNEKVPAEELLKVQNKTESTMVFSEMSLLDKTMNLAYFELLGDAENLNQETAKYLAVSADDIQAEAKQLFRKNNSSTLIYQPL